jgi:hypothetical protein
MEKLMNTQGTNGDSVTVALPKGFTYFIRDEDQIKIGSSMNPEQRIKSIEMQSGRSVQRLAIVAMEVCDEFQTHQKFAHLRLRGEWFRAGPDLLEYIDQIKATVYVAPPAPAAPIRKQAASPNAAQVTRGRLLARRRRVGPETIEGRILSNLIKQTAALATYERPAWATHPMQTLQGMMDWQIKLLAAVRYQRH